MMGIKQWRGKAMTNTAIPTIGKITPYEYQWSLTEAIKSFIREQFAEAKKGNEVKNGYCEAFVSAGKTIMIGTIANHCKNVGARCLVMAAQGELVEQDSDECWNMDTPNSIFSASLGRKSVHYPIVCGTSGTIVNHLDKEFKDWIPHVVLIDECHQVDWRDCLEEQPRTNYGKIYQHIKKQNPRAVFIGVTGTPFRGVESIKGPFWDQRIGNPIDREFLVNGGYIVPTVFGFGGEQYDLGEFESKNELGTDDFSASELSEMDRKIMESGATSGIIREVIAMTKERNTVMITCASERHCKEVSKYLPAGTWGIITQSTKKAERKAILDAAKTTKIKYLLQIGCLTTGLNRPLIDTSVILRRIGSLTLLIQLLGRGMRLLKQEHIDAGIKKTDHLVLDYSGTMESMGQLYENPILEDAMAAKDKKDGQEKECPVCGTINGEHARRCIGHDSDGNRCEHFFQSKVCEDLVRGGIVISKGCGATNDIAARECRKCGNLLIDYEKKLSGKHYSDADWKPVKEMNLKPTKNGGIFVEFKLDSYGVDGKQEVAKMFFNPWSSAGAKRMWRVKFVNIFINGVAWQNKVMAMPNNLAVINMRAMFDMPQMITHRINDKDQSVINGIRFATRTMKGGKRVADE